MGIVMFALLCGKLPFNRFSRDDAIRLLNGEVVFEPLTEDPSDPFANFISVSEEAKDLISKLLCPNPDERLSIEDAFSHPWFDMFQNEAEEFQQVNDGIFNAIDDDEINI